MLGLLMLVFAVALVAIHPPWDKVAAGFVPQVPSGLADQAAAAILLFRGRDPQRGDVPVRGLFLFVRWDRGGLGAQGPADQSRHDDRRLRIGFAAGDLDSRQFRAAVRPRAWSARRCRAPPRWRRQFRSARPGLLLALLGMLFAVAGAAVETCMSNAYAARPILRLGMGPAQEAVGGAALHPRLDRLLSLRWRSC